MKRASNDNGADTEVDQEFEQQVKRQRLGHVTQSNIEQWNDDFRQNPMNIIARNAVTCVGAMNASLDSERANNVTHIFQNSLKPETIRATNQESSGRCWMFAGLNVFRYLMIRAVDLENFEFSETYLFFYDKLERANYILQYFIDHPEAQLEDRFVNNLLSNHFCDGGYWNFFSNLVTKYGLVPKTAMEETYHSGCTSDMNDILYERILSCCNQIYKLHRHKNVSKERLTKLKDETMQQIYNTLVKFLGQPPASFTWHFKTTDKEPNAVHGLTPHSFKDMILATADINDFVPICNIPGKEYGKIYEVRHCNNMVGGVGCRILNLPIHELKKCAIKSISSGLPVWFAGDVSKGFGYHKSVLDDKIFNTDSLFGSAYKWSKEEKLKFGHTSGNHAMTLTGFNLGENGLPAEWQVENSWGYYDHEQPGLDGFLNMSDNWFSDNLVQLVVHKGLLTRTVARYLDQEPIILEPWNYMAPALKVKGEMDRHRQDRTKRYQKR